jgi:hypothetical protein
MPSARGFATPSWVDTAMARKLEPSTAESYPFVQKAVEAGRVWGLRAPDGWAVCLPRDFSERRVVPFWSSQEGARRAARQEWANFEVASVDLHELTDEILERMEADEAYVGIDWDSDTQGRELSAGTLADYLSSELCPTSEEVDSPAKKQLKDEAHRLAELFRDRHLSEGKARRELEKRCPGFSHAEYDSAFAEGLHNSR